ncbi:MAG: hypothetical protein K2M16_00735 [Muribaculaceae bacterium]|nr:hypothetical protein [Muribaculaceae bacterium]
MDILPLHIEYLLTRHDCVIVPGLGAFIATETEAYIDLEAGVIRPRRREIGFNSSVVTDDGLLAHSIARREGLAYEDARRMLTHLAERMTADLDNEGEVSLGMVGKLVKDSEGFISFQPRRSAILSDILNDISLSGRVSESTTAVEETPTADSVEEDDGMRTIKVKADRYVFTISKRAVHAAAMIVTILTVGLSLLMPINHDNEQKASVISVEEFFRRAVKSESIECMEKDKDSVIVEKNDSLVAEKVSATL